MEKRFYVYGYYYNQVPLYFGKGTLGRHTWHLREACLTNPRTRFTRELKRLHSLGIYPTLKVLIDGLSHDDALSEEDKLIGQYGRLDIDPNGILWNVAKGVRGWLHTEETKDNMAAHAKRRLKAGTMKTWATALSPEQRAKALQNSNGPQGKLCQYNLEGDLIKIWLDYNEVVSVLKVVPGRLSLAIKDPNVVCANSLWRRKEEPKIVVDKKLLEARAKKAKLQSAKSIEQLDDSGKIIKIWDSTSEATRTYGVRIAIDRALKTGSKAHGFYWQKHLKI